MDLDPQKRKKLKRIQPQVFDNKRFYKKYLIYIFFPEAKAMAEKAMSDPMSMVNNIKFW